MKLLIIVCHLFTLNVKQQGNPEITDLIVTSKIPDDCKLLYLAVTIKESGWHNNKTAVLKNNYSGFIAKGVLKRFSSLNSYQTYVESWFKRKHIYNKTHLYKLLISGKYCVFNNNKERVAYINTVNQIQKQITWKK